MSHRAPHDGSSHRRHAPPPDLVKASKTAEAMGLPNVERHIFLCTDTDEAGCANRKQMERSWDYLKDRLSQLGLSQNGHILPTRSMCFGICKSGPIAVVYPDGVWYGHCDPEVIERIIAEHLVGGRAVAEFVIAKPRE